MDTDRINELLSTLSDCNQDFSSELTDIGGLMYVFEAVLGNERDVASSDVIVTILKLINKSVVHYRDLILPKVKELMKLLKIDSFESKDLYVFTKVLKNKIKAYASLSNQCDMILAVGKAQGDIEPLENLFKKLQNKLTYFYDAISRLINHYQAIPLSEEEIDDPSISRIEDLSSRVSKMEKEIDDFRTNVIGSLVRIEKSLEKMNYK